MNPGRVGARAAVGGFLILAAAGCGGPVAGKPTDIERAVRLAQADSANVLVVTEASGKYRAFDATAVGAVAGNRVTLRKGSYGFFDGEGRGKPVKVAAALAERWSPPPDVRGNYVMTADADANVTLSFRYGSLAAETTIDVAQLLLVAKRK
jgi:hypothetical protein